jgi:hypothetical protein
MLLTEAECSVFAVKLPKTKPKLSESIPLLKASSVPRMRSENL